MKGDLKDYEKDFYLRGSKRSEEGALAARPGWVLVVWKVELFFIGLQEREELELLLEKRSTYRLLSRSANG